MNDTDNKLSYTDLLYCFVSLNIFEWPDQLAECKPDGWDDMSDNEKMRHPSSKHYWDLVHEKTSEKDRSLMWWLIELNRTSAQHEVWWNSGCKLNIDQVNARLSNGK